MPRPNKQNDAIAQALNMLGEIARVTGAREIARAVKKAKRELDAMRGRA